MQNQKKPIQQKKPMQNFTAEKWADKIALFIDNFGFLSGFFWHWTIALPSPTSHLAMLHSKIILSDPNRRVKVVCIGFSLFWSRCRTWGTWFCQNKHMKIKNGLLLSLFFFTWESRGYLRKSILHRVVTVSRYNFLSFPSFSTSIEQEHINRCEKKGWGMWVRRLRGMGACE